VRHPHRPLLLLLLLRRCRRHRPGTLLLQLLRRIKAVGTCKKRLRGST
jgi:hypothetical protein